MVFMGKNERGSVAKEEGGGKEHSSKVGEALVSQTSGQCLFFV